MTPLLAKTIFRNYNSSLVLNNDFLVNLAPHPFRYMYTQVRPSGECLRFMWHFCELKFAGPALDNLDANDLRFS